MRKNALCCDEVFNNTVLRRFLNKFNSHLLSEDKIKVNELTKNENSFRGSSTYIDNYLAVNIYLSRLTYLHTVQSSGPIRDQLWYKDLV